MAQTARPVASDSAQKTARRKKQERMHDFYVTAVSKETLLSEQYDKELSQVRRSVTGNAAPQICMSHVQEAASWPPLLRIRAACASISAAKRGPPEESADPPRLLVA
eukprot:6191981-Pleurochrysis_carterae.AAC.9